MAGNLLRSELRRALETLEHELLEANSRRSDGGGITRDGLTYAVLSVQEFLMALGWSDRIFPLSILSGALVDLDDGIVSPLLQPTRFANKPPDHALRNRIKGTCAASMDALMSKGMKSDEAAKYVVAIVERSALQINSHISVASWKTIRSWRANIKSRQRPHDDVSVTQFFKALPP